MASKFKRISAVTLPVLKFARGQPRYIYAMGAMYQGKTIDDKKEPATLMHACDMETGEEGVVICPAILKKELGEAYPNAGYVGKGFEIMITRDPEKKYNHVSISEVAIPDDFERPSVDIAAETAPAAKSAKK